MNRCMYCECIFNKVEVIKTNLGDMSVCPACGSTDYEEAFKCSICGSYKFGEDICKDICYKCARAEYTDRRGLEFIDNHKEFYLEHRGIYEVESEEEAGLIEDLRELYLSRIDMDNDCNKQLKHLKEYIFEDMDSWIEFLGEEINE